jgi:hypothetical protein
MDQRGAIEAALSALSVRWGEPYEVLAVPDEEERVLPAVDLLVQGRGDRLLVVEHTIVESFADRIRDDVLVSDFAAQVESALAGRLPNPGHYRVVLDPVSLPSRRGLGDLVTAVCDWVGSDAPSLEVGSPHSAPRHIREEVLASSDLKVRLERWPGRDGQVFVFRSVPEDLEEMRRERVDIALEAKCPKLADARADASESILVLESNDLALGNYSDIAAAVVAGLTDRTDTPDVVCLVETDAGVTVWLIKERDSLFPDLPSPGPLLGGRI